jgi:DNA-binding GntR family transcriptional regulator
MSGTMQPGPRIAICAIATALGASPMPLRETVRRRVTKRALETLPTRFITLPMMTPERFDGISQIWRV